MVRELRSLGWQKLRVINGSPVRSLRDAEVKQRRGMTSPDPPKIPEPAIGRTPSEVFLGIPREERPLRASSGQFSSERLSEGFLPLVLHLRSSSNQTCVLCVFPFLSEP